MEEVTWGYLRDAVGWGVDAWQTFLALLQVLNLLALLVWFKSTNTAWHTFLPGDAVGWGVGDLRTPLGRCCSGVLALLEQEYTC